MKDLSIKEKCELLVNEKLFETKHINEDFFAIKMNDGPAGLRMPTDTYPLGKPQFCLPCMNVLACSFNENVLYDIGRCLASQCINENVDIILAPGINIKRTPLCGRNFEYFSEDSYLTGILASNYVKGVQSLGIGTSLKHFCCNNREFDRLFQSSEVDYRTIREVYTKAFEMVIQDASPWTIMCSYNPINGINVAENRFILKDLLRDKLHFDNVLISDWGAVHNRIEALKASLDIQCPEDINSVNVLIEAYNNKIINDDDINPSINRIFNLCKKIKDNKVNRVALDDKSIHDICLNALQEGMVLLKNEDNILPLKDNTKIALLGNLVNEPSYFGGGSASVYLKEKIPSLINTLKEKLTNSKISYSKMFAYESCTLPLANITTMNLRHGYELAKNSDVVVIVVGTNNLIETESYDRRSLRLPESMEEVINNVSKYNKNVVVVIESGGVIDTSRFIDNIKGLLYAGFGGSVINEALANILSGKVSPSGRLSETYPYKLEDNPVNLNFGDGISDFYDEKLQGGYKYYDYNNIDVRFPFGYGLTYSKFIYNNINIIKNKKYNYSINITIENVGNYDASDVIQIYLKANNSKVFRVNKELVAFKKVFINKNDSKNISININDDAFKYFNESIDNWDIEDCNYEILVCKNAKEVIKSFKI